MILYVRDNQMATVTREASEPAHPDAVEVHGTPEQLAEWRKRQLEAYETYWKNRGLRGMSHL